MGAMKAKKRLITIVALSLMIIGCASEKTTTTTVTQSSPLPPASDPSTPPSQTTTTTTKTTSNEPHSVVGATANAVGTVILFPFRVVGDTLELIF